MKIKTILIFFVSLLSLGVMGQSTPLSVTKPLSVVSGITYQGSVDIVNNSSNDLFIRILDQTGQVLPNSEVIIGSASSGNFNFSFIATVSGNYTIWIGYDVVGNNTFSIDNFQLNQIELVEEQICSSVNDYRYGFNGMEKDDEVKGVGNSYDFGARMYDSRLGRWLSLDPQFFENSHENNYGYASNNPVLYLDVEGEDNIIYLVRIANGDDRSFEKYDVYKVRDEANRMLEKLGVETRVVVYDYEENGPFDESNLDDTDSYAWFGSEDAIMGKIPNAPNSHDGSLENANPGEMGMSIFVEEGAKYKEVLNAESEEQALAFAIVHGAGHNAENIEEANKAKGCGACDTHQHLHGDGDSNNANFMSSGATVGAILSSSPSDIIKNQTNSPEYSGGVFAGNYQGNNPDIKTLMDLFDPKRNQINIKNLESDDSFGKNRAQDNYAKNKAANL